MDMDSEQQVWQRVAGEVPGLRGMEQRSRESAAAFLQMSRSTSGDARTALEALHTAEHGTALTLRGMRILSGEEPEPARQYYGQQTALRRGLSQAYRRSLQARADYCAWAARNAEYAPVFRQLEQQEAKTQEKILKLLGSC